VMRDNHNHNHNILFYDCNYLWVPKKCPGHTSVCVLVFANSNDLLQNIVVSQKNPIICKHQYDLNI